MSKIKIPEIINLLGEENAQKIKDCITRCIIEEIEERFNESWIIDIDKLDGYFKGLAEEVQEEIAEEFKDRFREAIRKKLTGIDKDLEELA